MGLAKYPNASSSNGPTSQLFFTKNYPNYPNQRHQSAIYSAPHTKYRGKLLFYSRRCGQKGHGPLHAPVAKISWSPSNDAHRAIA